MKIAIVTNNYFPFSGGVVSSIEAFRNGLIQLGHEVNIITLDFLDNSNKEKNVFRVPCPIKFLYKKNHMAIPWKAFCNVSNILKGFEPDIIHVQHPFLLGSSALKFAKKQNIPIIFTYHTVYEKYLHYIPLPKLITEPITKKIVLSFCEEVDGIVAPGPDIQKFLSSKKELAKKVKVLPSPLLPVFCQRNLKIKKRSVKDIFKLVFTSRFVPEKNIPFLIKVFSKLDKKRFDFTLIGYGSELENLQKYAYENLGLSKDNIRFIEKPEKLIIAKFYRESDLFIFSSLSETQGIVLAEAMAGGLPVISLKGPGQNDIVKNEINGFLVDNEKQMLEKINLLVNNSELHLKLKQEAYKKSQEYYPENLTTKLLDFYKEFIKYTV